jgi:purine-nucleoside phosphorylase
MLAFDNKGVTSSQNVAISGSGTTSVMTFTTPAFTLTGATGSSPIFSVGTSGAVKADGNVVAVCSTGSSATRGSDNVSITNGQRVFLSANFTAVSDRNELAGKSFLEFNCSETAKTTPFTVNSDLSLTQSDGTKLTAAQAAFFSSDSGFTGPNGGNYKSRAYKRVSGGVTRYALVNIATDVNPAAQYVTVAFQN